MKVPRLVLHQEKDPEQPPPPPGFGVPPPPPEGFSPPPPPVGFQELSNDDSETTEDSSTIDHEAARRMLLGLDDPDEPEDEDARVGRRLDEAHLVDEPGAGV